jgi:hypothetical protein
MSCQRFREAIARHAAGVEPDRQTAAHLAACEQCRGLLEMQRQLLAEVDAELQRHLSVTASPEFAGAVTRAVRASHTRPARAWVPAAIWAGVAAAAALLAVVLLTSGGSPASPQRAAMDPAATGPGRSAPSPGSSGAPQREAGAASGRRRPDHALAKPARARTVRIRSVPARAAELPVVVDPTLALAIDRLRDLVAQGRLTEDVLPQPRTAAALVELSIPPLEVPDLKLPGETAGEAAAPRERQ